MEFNPGNNKSNNSNESNNSSNNQKSFQRLTAIKVLISELINGRYVKEEGWEPNYIITQKNKKVSRTNIIGTIISKDDLPSYENMVIDDGTASISIRNFETDKKFTDLNIGDIVLIIGKARQYGAELYILSEIVKKQDNLKWVEHRMKELDFNRDFENPKIIQPTNNEEKNIVKEVADESPKKEVTEQISEQQQANILTDNEKIVSIVRRMDNGEGASFDEVLKKYNGNGGEKILSDLMRIGEIFEIKPGKIKILE